MNPGDVHADFDAVGAFRQNSPIPHRLVNTGITRIWNPVAILIQIKNLDVAVGCVARIVICIGDIVALGRVVNRPQEKDLRAGVLSAGVIFETVHFTHAGNSGRIGRVLCIAPGQVRFAAVYRQGSKRQETNQPKRHQDSRLPFLTLNPLFHRSHSSRQPLWPTRRH